MLHDVRVGEMSGAVAHLAGHTSWVLSSAISPDARLAISGYVSHFDWILTSMFLMTWYRSADKSIRVWDLAATRSALSIVTEPAEIWSVGWRYPTGEPGVLVGAGGSAGFVSGSADGRVRWYRSAGAA